MTHRAAVAAERPLRWALDVEGGHVEVRCSCRCDGDFHLELSPVVLEHRRQAFHPGRWTQLDEVHGTDVVTVNHPGDQHLVTADGMVSAAVGAVLAIWVGDCAPVAVVGSRGTIAAVHAGWRGLLHGIVEQAVVAVAAVDQPVAMVLGPCIEPCCYEFGEELAQFVDRWGDGARSSTSAGTTALDVPAVIAAIADRFDVPLVRLGGCTGCLSTTFFSHRRRAERQRQVMTVVRRRFDVHQPSAP